MKGPQLFMILAVCILLLLGNIVLLLVSANGGSVIDAITGMFFDAFQITPGSFEGWLALIIVAGIAVIVISGTVSLVRYAIGMFRE